METNIPSAEDAELQAVASELHRLDPDGSKFAQIIRDTIDQLLDGRRNGRWNYLDLSKTEKTGMGTIIEINLQKNFGFDDGDATDYRIAGIEVDCKYSQRIGGWELGPEMVGHICLVVWASDEKSSWKAGLVRATEDNLRESRNRDMKRRLSEDAVNSIDWLWPNNTSLAPNQLLHLDPEKRERIMTARPKRAGKGVQARVNALFREVQGVLIRRTTFETVAHGADDPLKRARDNGGARDYLMAEGITVLGHQDNDPLVASALGLPIPHKGEFVSCRLVPVDGPTTNRLAAEIGGKYFAVAQPNDPVVAAPKIMRKN